MASRSLAPLGRSLLRSAPLAPRPAGSRLARNPLPLAVHAAQSSRVRNYSESSASAPKADNEEKRLEELEAAKQASEKKAGELEVQVKDLQKEMQYLRADMQTALRRAAEEKAKASEFAITSFAKALLETTDVLAKALLHVPQPIPADNEHLRQLFTGVELTQRQLLNTFSTHGVKKIESPKGTQFDPNLHEAAFQVPKEVAPKKADGAEHAPGEVIDVTKEGWTIGNRVLRPAQVGVVQME